LDVPAPGKSLLPGPDHINTNRTDFERMFAAEAPDYALHMDQADVSAHMDCYGWPIILEEIARGNLPNTLALRYRVPIIKFRHWLEARLASNKNGGAMFEEAMRLCAESMVIKSHMSLEQDVADATQGGMMRAFSKRIAEVAQSLDPGSWGKKDADGAGANMGTAIQINIGGGASIPGLEVLTGPIKKET
jgi:hypothetical protein